jgi:hypothetical protein
MYGTSHELYVAMGVLIFEAWCAFHGIVPDDDDNTGTYDLRLGRINS